MYICTYICAHAILCTIHMHLHTYCMCVRVCVLCVCVFVHMMCMYVHVYVPKGVLTCVSLSEKYIII